ncbi:GGDEF domain-containing protein [soil metagenome]
MPNDEDDLEKTNVTHSGELVRELLAKSQRDRAYLIVLQGGNVGEMYRLDGGESIIGRASTAHIKLGDDGVSRKHARVVADGGAVRIEDLGSSNGTLVNGVRVDVQQLKDGDKIQIGSTTILKFTYHDKLEESFQRQMYDAALRDGLTKAYNKKHFTHRLETEFAYAKRHGSALSLLMMDVDFFKKINDSYGHLAGDYVLTRLAQVAQSTLRTEDLFARYGGEEFAVLCRGVPLGSASVLGERIRSLIQSTSFVFETREIPVTLSVGVAAIPDLTLEQPLELVGSADEALYDAKRSGRNRVVLKK